MSMVLATLEIHFQKVNMIDIHLAVMLITIIRKTADTSIDRAPIPWLGSIIGQKPHCYAGDSLQSLNEIILTIPSPARTVVQQA